MLSLTCPGCRRPLRAKDGLAGKKIRCPRCQQVVMAAPAAAAANVGPSPGRTADWRSPSAGEGALPNAPTPPADLAVATPPPYAGSQPTEGAPAGAAAVGKAPDAPERLGGYRVLKELGRGGMGVVYQAEDPRLKRLVAVKVLARGLAGDEAARLRFLREAQAMAAVRHDHVVTIYQVDEADGVPFLAMEFLQGAPMDRWLKEGHRPTVAQVLRLGREIAEGLAAAHATGLIHRDIKPGNLWLDAPRERVKILDFGLARAAASDSTLTQQGAVVGTPAYMAPEQARGEAVDGRSDLFSLGVVLYYLCTGRQPFLGPNTLSTLRAVEKCVPTPPADVNSGIPRELSDLVMRLLEKQPARRPATADEVVGALRGLEEQLGPTKVTAGTIPAETVALPRAPRQKAAAPPSRRRRRASLAVLATAAVVAACLAGLAVIRISTDKGDLVIESDDDVEVTLKQGGKQVRVLDTRTNRTFAIAAGDYDAEVTEVPDGVRVATKHFTLTHGGREVLKVHVEPAKAANQAPAAPVVEARNADRRAAEWVLKVGGKVWVVPPDGVKTEVKTVDFLPIGAKCPIVAIELNSNANVDDAGLENLVGLAALEELDLGDTRVTDGGVRCLERLATLRKLSLAETPISSAAAASIGRLNGLHDLNLFQTAIGDDALVYVTTLPDLNALQLQRTRITDAGLKRLSHMTSLRHLNLGDLPITDDGLLALNGLTGLEELRLSGTEVAGIGWRPLGAMTNLRRLELRLCGRLTDDGLASLPQWPQLEFLGLIDTKITGEGLKSLSRFKRLRQVQLMGTPTSDEDARRLKAALPQCEIMPGCLLTTDPLDRYRDGKWVRFFSVKEDADGLEGCSFNQGILEVSDAAVGIPAVTATSFVFRAKARVARGHNCALLVHKIKGNWHFFDLYPDGAVAIGKVVDGRGISLATGRIPPPGDQFVDLAGVVEGHKLTLVAGRPGGFARLEAEDSELVGGIPGLLGFRGVGQFKDIEVQLLDGPKPERPALPK